MVLEDGRVAWLQVTCSEMSDTIKTAVTQVQELNSSERTSVTESLFRVDVLRSAGSGAVELRNGG